MTKKVLFECSMTLINDNGMVWVQLYEYDLVVGPKIFECIFLIQLGFEKMLCMAIMRSLITLIYRHSVYAMIPSSKAGSTYKHLFNGPVSAKVYQWGESWKYQKHHYSSLIFNFWVSILSLKSFLSFYSYYFINVEQMVWVSLL